MFDCSDRRSGNAKAPTQRPGSHASLAGRTNHDDLLRREFGYAACFPAAGCATTLRFAVGRVVCAGTLKQMVRAHTRGIVALVERARLRPTPECEKECDSVRIVLTASKPRRTIAPRASLSGPEVARAKLGTVWRDRAVSGHLGEEALLLRQIALASAASRTESTPAFAHFLASRVERGPAALTYSRDELGHGGNLP